MSNPTRPRHPQPIVPAAPVALDLVPLLRSRIVETLKKKVDEIAERSDFADRSFHDDAGRFHEYGAFWNVSPDHAANGYGKGDVAEVARELKRHGIGVSTEDIDAFLAQLVRTDCLEDAQVVVDVGGRAVTVDLDVDRRVPPPEEPREVRVRRWLLVEQRPEAYLVRPVSDKRLIATAFVVCRGDEVICSCRRGAGCDHGGVVREHRAAQHVLPHLGALRLSDAERTLIVRNVVSWLAPIGLFATSDVKRSRGNQPRTVPQRALQLILRALMGTGYAADLDAAALAKVRIIDEPAGETTIERYTKDPRTIDLLRNLHGFATRLVRARGIPVGEPNPATRGLAIAAEIVHALRLDARVSDLHAHADQEQSA